MRFWMLIIGIAIVSVFDALSLNSSVSKSGTTIAEPRETEPAPIPTPDPEE